MASEILTPSEIQQRIAVQRELAAQRDQAVLDSTKPYRYLRSLTDAANNLLEVIQNAEGRFMLGLQEIDMMTRGFGRGELIYVSGRAHAGKTQVILSSLLHNRDKRVLWFTPDEPAELVLTKLVALRSNLNAEEIEGRIKEGDQGTCDLVKRIAREDFRNLIVIDDALTLGQMAECLKEAEHYWDAKTDLVVIDFLELIPVEGDSPSDVSAKSAALKRWTKDADVPVICLHQASRSNGTRGQAITMESMRYGGENEAIFVLGVWRKRDDESLDEWERAAHEDTITIAVVKNKRPPAKRGQHDYHMDAATGRIRPLRSEDFTRTYSTAAEAREARDRGWEDQEML